MRDVDEALARAYGAARPPAADHPHVPPPPHVVPTNVTERAPASIAPVPTWPAAVDAGCCRRSVRPTPGRKSSSSARAIAVHRKLGRRVAIAPRDDHADLDDALGAAPGGGADASPTPIFPARMLARVLGLRVRSVGLDDVVEQGAALADGYIPLADRLTLLLGARPPILASSPVPPGRARPARLRRDFDLVLLDGGLFLLRARRRGPTARRRCRRPRA